MLEYFKKILILILLLGIITPSLNLRAQETAEGNAVRTAGEAGASAAFTAKVAATEVTITAAETIATTVFDLCIGKGGFDAINPVANVFGISPYAQATCGLQSSSIQGTLSDIALSSAFAGGHAAGQEIRVKKDLIARIIEFARKITYVLFKRVILDRLVQALIDWINRGGQGGIIENWGQFLDDAGNIAAGEFVQGLGAGFLCSPFSASLRFTLIPVERFGKMTCTLNDIIGNINNFLEDFRNGNWLAYQETWYPRNNFYGGVIIAINEAAKAEALGRNSAEKEGVAGLGYLSFTREQLYVDTNGNLDRKGNPVGPDYTGPRYKKDKRTITPGNFAAEAAVQSSIVAPITRVIHAEDLTLYLTAIVDAGINQLTILAADGLKGLSSRNAPPRINPQFPCAGLTGDAFRACTNSANAEKAGFALNQNDLRGAAAGSLETRNQLTGTLSQAIQLQQSYVDALAQLISSGKGGGREQELADEQAILDQLNDKFESNQSFVAALTAIDNKISGVTPLTGVTAEDWVGLSTSANSQFVDDGVNATNELTVTQKELQQIKDKVDAKLPGILSQLPTQTTTGQ